MSDNLVEIDTDRRGMNNLVQNLEDFEKDGAIQHGLFKAGEVFKAGGRRRLMDRMKSGKMGVTGNLLNSIHVRLKGNKQGVLTGFKMGKGGGSHANWIDLGTKLRTRRRIGGFPNIKKGIPKDKSTGAVIGNQFWGDTESQDYPLAMKHLYLGIENAAKRITRRR